MNLIGKIANFITDLNMGGGSFKPLPEGERPITGGMPDLCRQAAAEGAVLLENNGVLPLKPEDKIAVFGRCQLDWFYVGYGSGGDVKAPYFVNLMQGLENAGAIVNRKVAAAYEQFCTEKPKDEGYWGHWPLSYPEMPLDERLLRSASQVSDIAVVVIGRAAGESRENVLQPGSYYLTKEESAMLKAVTSAFRRTVLVLNIGNVMDLSWIEAYGNKISAVLLCWQGGMESGNAVADLLYGKTCPSGRLADTIARGYKFYPGSSSFGGKDYNNYTEDIFVGYRYFDRFGKQLVQYPFGYGLSYTSFSITEPELQVKEGIITVSATVSNTGSVAGKNAVLLWCSLPGGNIIKPERVLAGFGKTQELQPGESCRMSITTDYKAISSYDDTGDTGFRHAFVLEYGSYGFSMNDTPVGEYVQQATIVTEQLHPVLGVKKPFQRMNGDLVPGGCDWLKNRVMKNLPAEIVHTETEVNFREVMNGTATVEQFIATLSDKELEALTRGEGGMGSRLGTAGNAGAFGGIIPSLREKGVPPVITSDGPAGLRLQNYTSLLPNGAAQACSFNTELVEDMYELVGREMEKYNVDVLLGPGMNIHRNPLCGRNFEYFAEDPLLSGRMAAAVVKGVRRAGKIACPKHFACNNQETNRFFNDSRVSERALREIYLRNFEICVREAKPDIMMTSYNMINGVYSYYNYDLATTVLRAEWGYRGMLITDWYTKHGESEDFPLLKDNALRVRAQVDVLMPGNMKMGSKRYNPDKSLLATLGQRGGITRGEIQRCAANTLRFILKIKQPE